MKFMHFRDTTWPAFAAFLAFATASMVNAEIRPFTNDNGTVIEAELVSHKGDKVKLKRSDGKEFEVNPSIFSVEDEAYIKNWMVTNPAKTNYNFKVATLKKKMEGNSVNMGYKRVTNDLWSYVISVTNNSQDSVSNLTVKYRVFHSNSADGSYSTSNERSSLKMVEGFSNLDTNLTFNHTLEITTTPVQIDIVDYDGYGDRYKDQLKGCLVRIVDQTDNVIFDWVSPEVWMKEKSWLNTNPAKRGESKPAVIR